MMRQPLKKNGRQSVRTLAVLPPAPITANQNIMCWKCFPIRLAGYIWDMCATIRLVMLSPVTGVPKGLTSCIRWDGMRLACQPKMPPWNAECTPANGRLKILPACAHNYAVWDCLMTGRANLPPVLQITISMNRKCFSNFFRQVWPIVKKAG